MTSLIAIVPDSELSEPTLIVSPDVSTQDAVDVVPAAEVSDALLPQAVRTRPRAASAAGAVRARFENVGMNEPFRREE